MDYEQKYKYQFYLLQAAHKAKFLGYSVKMLVNKKSNNYCCLIMYTASGLAYYISAEDFIKRRVDPVYRIGSIQLDNSGKPVMVDNLYVTGLSRSLSEYIDSINNDVHITAQDSFKIFSLLSNNNDFIAWANDMDCTVFIRKYSTESDKILCTTNF